MKMHKSMLIVLLQLALLSACSSSASRSGAADKVLAASQVTAVVLPQDCSAESHMLVKERADGGDMHAQHLMGIKALYGVCDDPSLDVAIFYLSKSAKQFFPPSMFHLATALQLGGITSDGELLYLFRGAAERGFSKAEYNVVAYYLDIHSPVHDIAQGYAWHAFCAPHDFFCSMDEFDRRLSRMSKIELARGELLKAKLFEKMKTVEKMSDVFCCRGTSFGAGMGRH